MEIIMFTSLITGILEKVDYKTFWITSQTCSIQCLNYRRHFLVYKMSKSQQLIFLRQMWYVDYLQ